jgi:hypothetical protein
VNERFLAVCLFLYAAGTLATALRAALRIRDRVVAVLAVVLTLGIAAVLANAGADLWGLT